MLNLIRKLLGLNYYKSDLDSFLENLPKKYSYSQLKEIEKAQLIHTLRDQPTQDGAENKLWTNF